MQYIDKPYRFLEGKYFPKKMYIQFDWQKNITDNFIFMDGSNLPSKDYQLILYSNVIEMQLIKNDVLPNISGSPIVNLKVIELLTKLCPDDFQYFPVTIINDDKLEKFENKDYYIVNILRSIDSVDRNKSYIETYDDGADIKYIYQLYFRPHCMGSVRLARENYFKPLIMVDKIIKDEFKKHKIKGAVFQEDLEAYGRPFPEEYLTLVFPEDPEAAKRFFVSILNRAKDYEFFKTRIHKMPAEILRAIIDMTLSRSSFHAEQCAELLKMLNDK